ncbi:MAG: 3-hydroxyacyl-ACP dehydratase FabZ [Holosporaceae bacterium]|jgi:3-hydroxyacyl-[acyl-carrier-protein] dehydratase|nr:3-hydroxyacyl-ACP dehydratase FabZ [Holosporaceae bacterium]
MSSEDLINLTLDINEIKKYLPHRYPMLMIDRIEKLRPGESAIGIKNVTVNEPFFSGHFPNKPIMPGVFIVEAMGQTAGVVVAKNMELSQNGLVYFMAMDNVKFRKLVEPGNVLQLHVQKERRRDNVWRFRGEALVNNTLVAEAIFTAMIVIPEEK